MTDSKIIYTKTDEAPALATLSLLPIVQAFTAGSGVELETRDISLAGRIIASFPENLTDAQQQNDDLAELGELAKKPEANIVKLPNISASIPQLKAAIQELQSQGYDLPDYPEEPQNDEERAVKARYDKIKGSAVNPVLREGNSDRRVASSVKQYARNNPHRMGAWSADSESHVAHMSGGDFFGSEQSATIEEATQFRIELVDEQGEVSVLRPESPLQAGEIIDAAVMSRNALREFLASQIEDAKQQGVLLSIHMKATMMKVSDPIIFGHAVVAYYQDVFDKYADTFDKLGVDPNNGVGDVYAKIQNLPDADRSAIESDIQACSPTLA